MTVYLDVLIITNLYITYFLLLTTKWLFHRKTSKKRMVFAAVAGGLTSVVMLFPTLHPLLLILLKLLAAAMISLIAFGGSPIRLLMKNILCFFGVSFIYGGFMLALWYFITPPGMQYRNGTVYFNISAVMLMLSTVAAYFLIMLVTRLFYKPPRQHQTKSVKIECDGRAVLLTALIDTGNHLKDMITGLPVVVCELAALRDLLPEEVYLAFQKKQAETVLNSLWTKRIRMIPMTAVTGESLAISFRPEHIYFEDADDFRESRAIVAISTDALSDGEYRMLVGEAFLEN